jgi:hemerythrin
MVMKSIIWDDSLSIGIDVIDDDHKKLVDIMNELFTAAFAGVGDSMLDGIIERLCIYTAEHFEREEAFMERIGYPDLEAHRDKHRQLVEKIQGLVDRLKTGSKDDVSADMLIVLRDWVVIHIQEDDMAIKPFANNSKEG